MTHPTPPAQGLVAAVLEHPDDDAPRLVLADWLMERGDPRGEFIRIQCELAARTDMQDQELESLQHRESELLQKHGPGWCQQLGLVPQHCTFERGFVEGVRLSGRLFHERQDKLSTIPLRSLQLTDLSKQDLGQVLAWPGLTMLRGLCMAWTLLDDKGAKALAGSQCLAALTSLDLSYNQIGDDGVKALAGSQCLKALTSLDMSGNWIGDEGAKALADSQCLKALTSLSLAGNTIGDDVAKALANSQCLSDLASLNLRRNSISDQGVRELCERLGDGVSL